jgi:hypothetical protein
MLQIFKSTLIVIAVTVAACGFSLSFYSLVDLLDGKSQNLELSPYLHIHVHAGLMLALVLLMFGSLVLGAYALIKAKLF